MIKIDSGVLLGIAKNLKNLISEFRIQINSEGFKIIEVDSANICLINIIVNKEAMQEFEFKENATYCFNSDDFYNILKNNKKTSVCFNVIDNKAIFSFSNGLKSELALINSENELKTIPNMEFNAEIKINSKRFKEIIKNFSQFDSIAIDLKEDSLNFCASNGLNTSEICLNSDECYLKGIAKSKYSVEYLLKIVSEQISEDAVLCLNSDYPVMVKYDNPYFKINYLLAPRIEDD
jgi:hypothetical protein